MKNKSESVSEKYKVKISRFLCINNNNNPRETFTPMWDLWWTFVGCSFQPKMIKNQAVFYD